MAFFFLFSLFHLLPCAASKEEHEWCEALFQCGNITAGFPFWGEKRHHHCGHPLLELQCFNNITSLTISDNLYNVIHIDQSSNTLKLVRTDVLGSVCSSTFTNATLPSEIFELSPTYKSVTFYNCFSNHLYLLRYTCPEKGQMSESVNPEYPESCHNSFTVNVPKNFSPKEKDLNLNYLGSVLEEGFEVKVKIDVKACEECLSTHKFCGFNKSSPLEVKCGPLHQPTANELHKRCSGTFSCGNQRNLYYPFWIPETEGCGHPEFKLECGRFAEFRVSSVKFRVLEMNSSIIRLARLDFIDELCPDYPPDELFNKNVLPLAPNTEMLTIYFDCKLDFAPSLSPFGTKLDCADDRTDDKTNYYVTRNLSSSLLYGIRGQLNDLKVCDRNVSIPASGPALTSLQKSLSEDDLKKALTDGFDLGLNQECLTCLESRGACGYNLNSDRFTCYFLENKGNISYIL